METDIDILRNEKGEFLVNKDFNVKFYKFIVDHYLRKFHCCFYLHSIHLITVFVLNAAQPEETLAHTSGESQASEKRASEESASGEPTSASGGQVLELEQKNEEKSPLLQKLKLKFHRRQRS